MKKGIIAILTVFLAVLLSVSVLGAGAFTVTPEDDYFERSNPADSEDDDELDHSGDAAYGTAVIELINKNYTINSVGDIELVYYDQDYDTGYDIMQEPGEEYEDDEGEIFYISSFDSLTAESVKINFLITPELSAIDSDGDEVIHKVNVDVNYTKSDSVYNATTNTTVVTTEDLVEVVVIEFKVENQLTMDKETVDFDAESTSADCDLGDDDCSDDIDIFIPGEDIEMTFTLVNKLDDISVEDIEIEIDLDGDVEDDSLDDGINSIKKDSETDVSFKIEPETDAEDELGIDILVYGEDEFGAGHGFFYSFDDLEFDVPEVNMDLDVNSVPASVCQGDYVTVSGKVTNKGTEDQERARVQVVESTLKWADQEYFNLGGEDGGDFEDDTFNFEFEVSSSARIKTYNPRIELIFEDEDGDADSIFESLSFAVVSCDESDNTDDSDTGSDDSDSNTGSGSDDTNTGSGMQIGTPEESDLTEGQTAGTASAPGVVVATPKDSNSLATAGIVLLILILIVAILAMVAVLFKK